MKVAAVLRDGRGSQQRGGRRFKEGVGGWRPSSVTAEDRNRIFAYDGDLALMWRPSSVTAEDRNSGGTAYSAPWGAGGGRPP